MDAQDHGSLLDNRWDDAVADKLSPEELLVYRSNLLGSDKRITNYGGGNTSSKLDDAGPADRRDGQGAVGERLGRRYRQHQAGWLRNALYGQAAQPAVDLQEPDAGRRDGRRSITHCTFNLNPRATSIDTPLHGFIDHPHVDHVHPDAIIAIAASADSQRADTGDFRRQRGLGAVAAPGLRAWPVAASTSPMRTHARAAWCWKRTACSPGARRRRSATRRRSTSSTGDLASWPCAAVAAPLSAASALRPPTRRQRRAVAAALMPVIRGLISQSGTAQNRSFR